MTYTINGVNISAYGITPSHGANSNIALSGHLNLPARLGETYHIWGESDGVEPYVLADEISFGGIDIIFTGLIKGTRKVGIDYLEVMIANINAVSGTVVLGTPFGNYDVYLKTITTVQTKNIREVVITFRQPAIQFPVLTLPATGSATYALNGIPFSSFGLINKNTPDYSVPELQNQEITVYNEEKFKPVKRGLKKITLDCTFKASSISAFAQNAALLRKYFSDPGLKTIKLDTWTISAFAVDGFEITDISVYGQAYIANFKVQLIVESETIA